MIIRPPSVSNIIPPPPVTGGPFTIEQICDMALQLDPVRATRLKNGSMVAACTIGVFTEIIDESGQVRTLSYLKNNPDTGEYLPTYPEDPDGEYAAILVRVSTSIQVDDGWSVRDQVERGLAECIKNGWACRIYNDMGLSGRLPMLDNHAIRRMRTKRKIVYERLFEKVFLDQSIAIRYTPAQKCTFKEYRRERGAKFMVGESDGGEQPEELVAVKGTGKRKQEAGKPSFRPALTVMLQQFPCIHTMLLAEQSRLCRSSVLFAEIIEQMHANHVKAQGTIGNLDWMNGSDMAKDILQGIFGRMSESQLEEVLLGSLRGILARLMSGRPHANTPFWLTKREETGIATLLNADIVQTHTAKEERAQGMPTLRRLLELWQSVDHHGEDRGVGAVASSLQEEGWLRPGKSDAWTSATVRDILTNHALRGVQYMFGCEWQVFPPVLTDMEFWDIQRKLLERSEVFANSRVAARVHLLAGILHCSCGAPMVRVPSSSGSHTYTCLMLRSRRDDYTEFHISTSQRRIEEFVNMLMTEFSPAIIRDLRRAAQGNSARQESHFLAERAQTLRGLIQAKEEQVKVEAEEAVLRTLKNRDHKRFSIRMREAIDDLLEEDVDYGRFKSDVQKLEARQTALQRALEKSMPSQELDRLVGDIESWSDLDTVGKNLLLLDLLVEIRFDGTHPNETLLMVKRTLDEETFAPIPVKTTVRSNGTVLREYPTSHELQTWLVGMLDAAIAYPEDNAFDEETSVPGAVPAPPFRGSASHRKHKD